MDADTSSAAMEAGAYDAPVNAIQASVRVLVRIRPQLVTPSNNEVRHTLTEFRMRVR